MLLDMVAGAVLQQEQRADLAPAEGGDDEVEIAVPVEIGHLDVGHAGQAGGQDVLAIASGGEPLQPDEWPEEFR